MSGRSDDDELADLLRDLERDLDRLTDRLDADDAEASVRRRSRPRRRAPPGARPPSPGDLVRFTEEYTIPTVVAVLEATIRSLELLRGGIRLADPERRLRDDERGDAGRSAGVRDRVARELGDGASAAVERTLSDLRTALSATELPEDDDARAILEDARSLTDEIERRLTESDGARDAGGDDRGEASGRRAEERGREGRPETRDRDRRRRSPRRGVGIEVRDAAAGRDTDDGRDADDDRDDGDGRDDGGDGDGDAADEAQVDVDAELESIRREVGDDGDESRDGDDGDESRDGDDGDESRDGDDGDESREGDGGDESREGDGGGESGNENESGDGDA